MDQVPNGGTGTPNVAGTFASISVAGSADFADRPRLTTGADVSNTLSATPASAGLPITFKRSGFFMLTYKLWITGAAAAAGGIKFSSVGAGITINTSAVKSLLGGATAPQINAAIAALFAGANCTFDMSGATVGYAEIEIGVIVAAAGQIFDLQFAPVTNTQSITIKAGSQVYGLGA